MYYQYTQVAIYTMPNLVTVVFKLPMTLIMKMSVDFNANEAATCCQHVVLHPIEQHFLICFYRLTFVIGGMHHLIKSLLKEVQLI